MKLLPLLFSLTLFMAALLSFSVQPIFGKMMLPMIGGAPAGWIVAMAFFQLALLGGYGVSYLLGRFSPWVHAAGLLLLYISGYTFLPPHILALPDNVQGEALSFAVIQALARSILFPFLALTATTAALQRVFSATSHPTASDPYYLFVASNIGSFIGLFAYPLILEPFFGLHDQTSFWQAGYIAATMLIVASCVFGWKYRNQLPLQPHIRDDSITPVTGRQVIWWMLLAFLPCSLSMGVTSLITDDVGGLPLFWVIPLGLYLLTFILAFGKRQLIAGGMLENLHVIGVVFLIAILTLGISYHPTGDIGLFLVMVSLLLAVFFVIALSSHQRLAAARPQTRYLTLYYFIIALGGALAGVLHAFVIPFVLPYAFEFVITAVFSLVLVTDRFDEQFNRPHLQRYAKIFTPALLLGLTALLITTFLQSLDAGRLAVLLPGVVFVAVAMLMSVRPRSLLLLGVSALVASTFVYGPGKLVYRTRNFFGVMAVVDTKTPDFTMRVLMHGNTSHGMQVIENKHPERPMDFAYYANNNPITDILNVVKGHALAVVGLGAGTMACYDAKLTVDFYEIDPEIERIARRYFTYLRDCPPRRTVIGDGRLAIARSNSSYDVILMDAFSSDGIPLHLLTTEALGMFLQHLKPDGVMLYHISNRYLDLAPPLAAIARANHLHAYYKQHFPKGESRNQFSSLSQWLAIPTTLETGAKLVADGWYEVAVDKSAWTDDRSSLVEAVKNFWH